jgi:glycosyltransferase involved in cell wall biosynthesis
MKKVSVETSTYNRKEILKMVLQRLAEQTYPASEFEVVISDDGSTDGLVEMVRGFLPELPYEVRIVENDRSGVGHNHNQGIKACRGELVIMLAADILVVPQLIEEFVTSHEQDPDPALFVAGQLRQAPNISTSMFNQAYDVLVERLFEDNLKGIHVQHFWVSNISFKKQFMLEHGMFHEWQYAAGEDIELGYRLRERGMRLIKNPRAIGYHHHEVDAKSIALRSYSTGYYRHILEQHLTDPEFLKKIEKLPRRGVAARLKNVVRPCVNNRFVINSVVLPLIDLAERMPRLKPILPMLIQRMASYYIAKGMRDQKKGVPFDPLQAKIYTTDPH